MNLKEYTDKHTQIALAKAIKAAPSFVNQWVSGDRPIPSKYCVAIERETAGQVTRQTLRPDDWQDIWPELRDATKEKVY